MKNHKFLIGLVVLLVATQLACATFADNLPQLPAAPSLPSGNSGDAEEAPAAVQQLQATPTIEAPDVPGVQPPVEELVADVPQVTNICNTALVGESMAIEATTKIAVNLPADRNWILVSMDSALIEYNGETLNTVYGALILADDSFTIVTKEGASGGLGWNRENWRYNITPCALDVSLNPFAELRDLQFGRKDDPGHEGEKKPLGVYIANGEMTVIWNYDNGLYTVDQFNTDFGSALP